MIVNRILLAWGAGIIFILCILPLPVGASPNVSDCIENNKECTSEEINSEEETEVLNEDNNDLVVNGDNSSPSLVFEIIQLFFALLLVIGLIYVVLKLLGKRNKLGSNMKSLENVGGISVGQNKSIQIVRIGNQIYMVGVGDNVQLLQEITDEETIQHILNVEQQSEDFLGTNFTSLLKKKNSSENNSDQSFEKLFEQELNSLKSNRNKMIQKYKEDSHE